MNFKERYQQEMEHIELKKSFRDTLSALVATTMPSSP